MTALDKPRPILTPTISIHGRWRFLVVTHSAKNRGRNGTADQSVV